MSKSGGCGSSGQSAVGSGLHCNQRRAARSHRGTQSSSWERSGRRGLISRKKLMDKSQQNSPIFNRD